MKKKSAVRGAARRSTSSRRTARNDAITLLKKDHESVLAMFRKFTSLASGKRGDRQSKEALAQRICKELKVHTTIEEEIFYPAVRAEIGENLLMDEAQVEHDGAKNLIEQIESMHAGDDMFDAKVTVLGEMIKHHVKEEHEEIFPKARKAKKVDLGALGQQLAARKQEIAGTRGAPDARY